MLGALDAPSSVCSVEWLLGGLVNDSDPARIDNVDISDEVSSNRVELLDLEVRSLGVPQVSGVLFRRLEARRARRHN